MQASAPTGWTVLVATLAASGLLIAWYVGESQGPAEPVDVEVHVVSYDELFNGSLHLEGANATPLGALLAAANASGFEVDVSDAYWEPFVTSIDGRTNQGACGWVYDVNGDRPVVGAASYTLRDDDVVEWYWTCTGGS